MHDVRIVLSSDTGTIDYTIKAHDNQLARDWLVALENILKAGLTLNKNFCFLGFPNTPRDLDFLCNKLNHAIREINLHDWQQYGLEPYVIEEHFVPDAVRFGPEYPKPPGMSDSSLFLSVKHDILNRIHNHFERLQGTVENESAYHKHAPFNVRRAIGHLNTVCHEIESLILSYRKHVLLPEWTRPSQITTFHSAPRYELTSQHKQLFKQNAYNKRFGEVYMHWAQIGKTLFEVFRDEHAPKLDTATCEAITHLKYYSGEFDIEWGRDLLEGQFPWHDKQMQDFRQWLADNQFDINDENLCLGYAPIGQVEILKSFGTENPAEVWRILEQHLNIQSIECGSTKIDYNYTWRDQDV
jgi:hypothetical protein